MILLSSYRKYLGYTSGDFETLMFHPIAMAPPCLPSRTPPMCPAPPTCWRSQRRSTWSKILEDLVAKPRRSPTISGILDTHHTQNHCTQHGYVRISRICHPMVFLVFYSIHDSSSTLIYVSTSYESYIIPWFQKC